jgi:hypothetical protein
MAFRMIPYAREFLRAREIAEQLKENKKQQSLEPGRQI